MILQVEVAWQRTYSLGQRVTERIKKRNAQVLQPLLVGLGVVGLAFTLIDRSRVTKLILARRDMSSHQNFATTRYIDVSCFGSSIFIILSVCRLCQVPARIAAVSFSNDRSCSGNIPTEEQHKHHSSSTFSVITGAVVVLLLCCSGCRSFLACFWACLTPSPCSLGSEAACADIRPCLKARYLVA